MALVRERRLERAALVLLLGGLSLTAFRYLPFFVLGAGPYVAVGLSRLSPRLLPASSLVEAVVAAGSAAALVLGVRGEWMFQRGVREGSVPLDAVAYLERAHASGKVLSAFEWGGYVIWGTEARVRPFVDARNLDERKFAEYTHMIWATQDGLRYFAREGFDYVLLPPGNRFTGEAYPLNVLLMRDAGWRLAYSDGTGFLFASRAAAAPDR